MPIPSPAPADPAPRPALPGWAALAAALLFVAAVTALGLAIAPRWGSGSVVLLYLPPVLAAAAWFGRGPALTAALASTLAFNYWFTAPFHTLMIHSPADVVTVAMLLLVALVTSHLAASLRAQGRLAAAHAARNATIAGFARRLLSCAGADDIAQVAATELARLFQCHAVLVAGSPDPAPLDAAPGTAGLAPSDLAAAALTLETGEVTGRGVRRASPADWQFHPVSADGAPLAAIGLAREDGAGPVAEDQRSLLASLLDQVALALERARLEREAREITVLRERDTLRAALLGSIGEEVRPRIAAIAAGTRALRREGTADKAITAGIAEEAGKLDRFVDNLVALDPAGDQRPLVFGPIAVDLHRRAVTRDGAEVHLTPKEYAVLAELARHAGRVLSHAHLLRSVWGPAQDDHVDYLRVAIRALRQKLEADPAHPALILNEPAVGYRLAAG